MSKIVEHHIKYKEIHGVDETVWLTMSEHKKLHFRLRNEQKCNIPVDELTKISIAAHSRTKKCLNYQRKYQLSYYKKNIQRLDFTESYGIYTSFHEMIVYNHKTGTVTYSALFCGNKNHKLPVIDI